MPRRYRRYERRRGSSTPLVILLVLAVLLLLVLMNGRGITLPIPPLPNIPNVTIPITGLPEIQIPAVQIPITVVPGTLVPNIGIGGTAVPNAAAVLGQQSKSSGCASQSGLPDKACTPGAVTSATSSQICQVGYASSVRDVSTQTKDQVYGEYGVTNHAPGQYEVDHLVPLELGGSNDIANLWPEPASPKPGFHEKDMVENYLHAQVCAGKITLADAQREIASNWLAVYNQMPK